MRAAENALPDSVEFVGSNLNLVCRVTCDGRRGRATTAKDGGTVVAVDPVKVAAMLEATGDLGDWNGGAKLTPGVTADEPAAGDSAETMRFKVTPGDGTAPRAFLRIRK